MARGPSRHSRPSTRATRLLPVGALHLSAPRLAIITKLGSRFLRLSGAPGSSSVILGHDRWRRTCPHRRRLTRCETDQPAVRVGNERFRNASDSPHRCCFRAETGPSHPDSADLLFPQPALSKTFGQTRELAEGRRALKSFRLTHAQFYRYALRALSRVTLRWRSGGPETRDHRSAFVR